MSNAREIAETVTKEAIDGIVGAIDKEAARRRCEACSDKIFHEEMIEELQQDRPVFWRLRRLHHRRLRRRAHSRCEALKRGGDVAAAAIMSCKAYRG